MKPTTPKTPLTLRSILALAALVPSLALARPAPGPGPAPAPTTEPSAATLAGGVEAWNQIRIDLSLNGGTPLPDYIAYLSDVTKGNFILLSDPSIDPASIHLPPLKLRSMPLGSAIQLLQELPGTDIKVEPDDNPATTVPTFRIVVRMPGGAGFFAPAGAPAAAVTPTPATEPVEKPQTKLFALGRILFGSDAPPLPSTEPSAREGGDKIDQLLQLIDLTLAASAGDDPHAPRAQINYHAPTRTLIVRATADQMAAIEEAIHALAPDPADPQQAVEQARRELQMNFDRQREAYTSHMQSFEDELSRLRPELAARQRERDEAVLRADRLAQALAGAKVSNPTTQP